MVNTHWLLLRHPPTYNCCHSGGSATFSLQNLRSQHNLEMLHCINQLRHPVILMKIGGFSMTCTPQNPRLSCSIPLFSLKQRAFLQEKLLYPIHNIITLDSFHLCEQSPFPPWYAWLERIGNLHFKYFFHWKRQAVPLSWQHHSVFKIQTDFVNHLHQLNQRKKCKKKVSMLYIFIFKKKKSSLWFLNDSANTLNLTVQFSLGWK